MEKAAEILKHGLTVMPDKAIAYDLANGQSVPLLFEVGEDDLALDIVEKISVKSVQMLDFYIRTGRNYDREAMISMEMLRYFVPLLEERGYTELSTQLKQDLERFLGPDGGMNMNRR
jgi:hypothetical protein